MRVAVTGHMDLSPSSAKPVRAALREALGAIGDGGSVVGISCLARGADSIFAEAVLEDGGELEVVLPSPHYRDAKVKPDHAPLFDRLLERAATVITLPHEEVDKDAYEAANETLLGTCDRLIAVWDGAPGKRSGTASVVEQARARGVPVTVVWPDGAARG